MQTLGLNTQMGIDLAQRGRKREALAYLRHAVMTEPVTAEVWLWLAHVTPDLDEYRNCVYQALQLVPHHPTALRMQQDITYQAQGAPPPLHADDAAQTLSQPHKRSNRLRRILFLVNAIIAVTLCGWLGAAGLDGFTVEDLQRYLPFLESSKRIQFTVGEAESFGFRVDVPQTWYLADSGSPSWQAERDRLQRDWPNAGATGNFWRRSELDLSIARRNPNSGEFLQPIMILETESERIASAPQVVPSLALIGISPLRSAPDNRCETLRAFAATDRPEPDQIEAFVAAEVRERAEDDCLYFTHYKDTLNDVALRRLTLRLPIGERDLAEWQILIPESLYRQHYESVVNRIIDSLSYLPSDSPPDSPQPNATLTPNAEAD